MPMNPTSLPVTEWLADIAGDAPCGPDLEYDPSFLALERAASGRPDAEYGDTLVAAVPPDWNETETLCIELLARSRDLRVVAYLSRARLARRGIEGLAEGLALIEGLLERQWDAVHPQLDVSEGNDSTARVNALAPFADPTGIANDLADIALVPQMPTQPAAVTLRQWMWASGEAAVPNQQVALSAAEIDAAIAASIGTAQTSHAAAVAALASVERIEAVLTEHVGVAGAIDLAPLKLPLQRIGAFLGERLAKLGAAANASAADATDANATNDASNATAAAHAAAPDPSRIASRGDVTAMIDRICDYYARQEPSSPVPLILMRARGLVDKTFIDIMRDLAPDGLAQVTVVTGASPD
ncbi:Uncharacterized protein ImpA [Caballeronia glathei]|jgi:type VI secretion system protein ImpA|nr:Uncharacterized protein ImpA [Caballeronia glathei]